MDYCNLIGRSYNPHPRLQNYISQYNISNSKGRVVDEVKIKSIPFGLAGILLFIGNSGLSFISEKFGDRKLHKAHLVGFSPVHLESYVKINSEILRGVSISLTYLGVNHLLQLPIKLLLNNIIDLDLILGQKVYLLLEKLQEAPTDVEIVSILDDFFIQLIKNKNRVRQSFLAHLNHILNANYQMVNVNELASQSHLHERSLERKFKAEMGLSPKEFLRLMRFIKIIHLISDNPHIPVHDLVWLGRFFDQSHLIHEFKKISNHTPSDFYKIFQSSYSKESETFP